MKFFTAVFTQFISYCRMILNAISNNLELNIWKMRKKIIFTGLYTILGYQIYKLLTLVQMLELTDVSSSNNTLFLVTIILFFIIFLEYYIRSKNLFPNFITFGDRFFVICPYAWSLIELTLAFNDFAVQFLASVFEPKQLIPMLKFALPTLQAYNSLPGSNLGIISFIIFYLFFYGVGRNKESFIFFVRYHYVQVILLSALFSFQHHFFTLLLKANLLSSDTIIYLGASLYGFNLLILAYSLLTALCGFETTFPFIHTSIQYHTGRKENESINPFDNL